MSSYQKLKNKCEKLQAQVDMFKDAMIIAEKSPVETFNISISDRNTLSFTEQILIQRRQMIDEKIKNELQLWVVENLDEETIMKLLKLKKENKQ